MPRRSNSLRTLLLLCAATLLATPLSACGDDDGTVDPPPDFTREDALMACVAADACGVMTYAYAGSFCLETGWDQRRITGTTEIWAQIYECVLNAVPDCDAVGRCFGAGSPLQACSEPSDGYCSGTIQVACDTAQQTLIMQDCGLADQTCTMANVTMTDTVPKCGMGSCTEGVDQAVCDGFLLYSCAGGNWEVTDCSVQGMMCGDGPTDTKACIGTGTGCPDDHPAQCDGDVLRDCVNRHLRVLDCGELPGDFTCSTSNYSCVPAGTDCTPGDPELCQGATIRICVDGSWFALDCGDLGFTSCSVSAAQGAHCVP